MLLATRFSTSSLGVIVASTISIETGEIDLENSSVIEILRQSEEIVVKLNKAKLISSSGQVKILEAPILKLQGVSKESAVKYVEAGIAGIHPDPARAIELIEVVEYSSNKLVLEGYFKNEPWYVWSIEFKAITVSCKEENCNAT